MITVYYRSRCSSSGKTLKWLEAHNIEYKKKDIGMLTQENILLILASSTNGIDDILKHPKEIKHEKKIKAIKSMYFSEAMKYLVTHKEIIRTPIIISEEKQLVGYNDFELRKFIPQNRRKYYKRVFY